MKSFSKVNFIGNILLIFLVWRFILFFIAYIGPFVVREWGNRFPYAKEHLISTSLPYWIWSWGNFDGVHYLTIAKSFYSAYYTQTFFPFYPLTIRFLAKLLFNNYFISAFIIANLSFLASLFIFRKLLLLDKYSDKFIFWVIIFLLFFPTSFYFGSIYTESLFLLFVVTSFYFAREKKWLFAGFVGMFAAATRLLGLFLFFALLVEYFFQNQAKKKTITPLFFISLIPLGLIFYMIFLKIKFDDSLLFWHAQPAFGAERLGRGIIFPPQVIFRYFKILITVDFKTLPFWNALFELVSFLFAVLMLVIAHIKKIRLSYLVFAWLSLITPVLTGTLSSMPRYILIVFPIFIVFGFLKKVWLKFVILVLSGIILTIAVILFTRGYWLS